MAAKICIKTPERPGQQVFPVLFCKRSDKRILCVGWPDELIPAFYTGERKEQDDG
jgi:hypothetical protein